MSKILVLHETYLFTNVRDMVMNKVRGEKEGGKEKGIVY